MKDWVVLIACGLIGWGVVSWLISVIWPPRQPSAKDADEAPLLRLARETRLDAQAPPPMSATTSDAGTGTRAATASDAGTSTRAATASDAGTSTRAATTSDAGISARAATASDAGTSTRAATTSDAGISARAATTSNAGISTGTARATDVATNTPTHSVTAIDTGPSPSRGTGLETAWPAILQVDMSATAVEIEKAYHELLAECDRIRFSTWYSAQERQEAEARRAKVCAAYEFIRPRR